ncbi:MAG TPA: dTDP-4-dehydrorhamnose 3,5-epimerase family protein [Vicinamibacterales bacterium]|nr:dTDP-4-dehydrorhamnose 3,5-epimerase family protein [Vicinamibacterales bacterium]
MKILSVSALALPDVKIVRFARFADNRGYFTEPYRRSDFDQHPELAFMRGVALPQMNESWSKPGVVRGLHFQWNPFMGKLVRTISGRMVDLFLDIRLGSPTFGLIAAHDMPAADEAPHSEWIWVPPGFAHGNFFTETSRIEYLCSGEYSPGCEAGLSPLAPDLDWTRCDPALKAQFDGLVTSGAIISEKDTAGLTLTAWQADERSKQFVHGQC